MSEIRHGVQDPVNRVLEAIEGQEAATSDFGASNVLEPSPPPTATQGGGPGVTQTDALGLLQQATAGAEARAGALRDNDIQAVVPRLVSLVQDIQNFTLPQPSIVQRALNPAAVSRRRAEEMQIKRDMLSSVLPAINQLLEEERLRNAPSAFERRAGELVANELERMHEAQRRRQVLDEYEASTGSKLPEATRLQFIEAGTTATDLTTDESNIEDRSLYFSRLTLMATRFGSDVAGATAFARKEFPDHVQMFENIAQLAADTEAKKKAENEPFSPRFATIDDAVKYAMDIAKDRSKNSEIVARAIRTPQRTETGVRDVVNIVRQPSLTVEEALRQVIEQDVTELGPMFGIQKPNPADIGGGTNQSGQSVDALRGSLGLIRKKLQEREGGAAEIEDASVESIER